MLYKKNLINSFITNKLHPKKYIMDIVQILKLAPYEEYKETCQQQQLQMDKMVDLYNCLMVACRD